MKNLLQEKNPKKETQLILSPEYPITKSQKKVNFLFCA